MDLVPLCTHLADVCASLIEPWPICWILLGDGSAIGAPSSESLRARRRRSGSMSHGLRVGFFLAMAISDEWIDG
jgi:hypothetical protein